VGRWFLQVCRTTSCWLRGSDDVTEVCRKKLGITPGHTSADGQFTLVEVECLGACVNAPILQVNDDFYEDLDAASTEKLLDSLAAGTQPSYGSVIGRQGSMPEGGKTTLTEVSAKNGN
jgi:NADH:ubiquinone oxidoreductase subunit E